MDKEKDKSKKKGEKKPFFRNNCVNFIKKNWMILLLALFCVGLGIVIVLACAGWRMVYAPELEPNWESVSAAATCVSVFFSVLAIIFAITVPRNISEQQNKIALYEKRLKTFNALEMIYDYFVRISEKDKQDLAVWQFEYWSIHSLLEKEKIANMRFQIEAKSLITYNCIKSDERILDEIVFLFPDIDRQEIRAISKRYSKFMFHIFGMGADRIAGNEIQEKTDSLRLEIWDIYKAFFDKQRHKMIEFLMLTK